MLLDDIARLGRVCGGALETLTPHRIWLPCKGVDRSRQARRHLETGNVLQAGVRLHYELSVLIVYYAPARHLDINLAMVVSRGIIPGEHSQHYLWIQIIQVRV